MYRVTSIRFDRMCTCVLLYRRVRVHASSFSAKEISLISHHLYDRRVQWCTSYVPAHPTLAVVGRRSPIDLRVSTAFGVDLFSFRDTPSRHDFPSRTTSAWITRTRSVHAREFFDFAKTTHYNNNGLDWKCSIPSGHRRSICRLWLFVYGRVDSNKIKSKLNASSILLFVSLNTY